MCKYCETKENIYVPFYMENTAEIKPCYVVGKSWGRGGFSRDRKWFDRCRIVRTQDKRFRINVRDRLTPPIEYCPKCGRRLDATS